VGRRWWSGIGPGTVDREEWTVNFFPLVATGGEATVVQRRIMFHEANDFNSFLEKELWICTEDSMRRRATGEPEKPVDNG
jgi:hypothetical protein